MVIISQKLAVARRSKQGLRSASLQIQTYKNTKAVNVNAQEHVSFKHLNGLYRKVGKTSPWGKNIGIFGILKFWNIKKLKIVSVSYHSNGWGNSLMVAI